jgi:hypothetical protein
MTKNNFYNKILLIVNNKNKNVKGIIKNFTKMNKKMINKIKIINNNLMIKTQIKKRKEFSIQIFKMNRLMKMMNLIVKTKVAIKMEVLKK